VRVYAPRTINNGEEPGKRNERELLSYIIRSEIDLGISEEDSLEYT